MSSAFFFTGHFEKVTGTQLKVTGTQLKVTGTQLKVTGTQLKVTEKRHVFPISFLHGQILNFNYELVHQDGKGYHWSPWPISDTVLLISYSFMLFAFDYYFSDSQLCLRYTVLWFRIRIIWLIWPDPDQF